MSDLYSISLCLWQSINTLKSDILPPLSAVSLGNHRTQLSEEQRRSAPEPSIPSEAPQHRPLQEQTAIQTPNLSPGTITMSLATNPPSTASAPPSVSARQNLKRSVQQAFEGSHFLHLSSFRYRIETGFVTSFLRVTLHLIFITFRGQGFVQLISAIGEVRPDECLCR